jgi:hypothetical protein
LQRSLVITTKAKVGCFYIRRKSIKSYQIWDERSIWVNSRLKFYLFNLGLNFFPNSNYNVESN